MAAGNTKSPTRRASSRVLAAILGGILALVCVAVIAVLRMRDPLPPLNRTIFNEAVTRWESSGTHDYDVQVQVRGRQPAVYGVQVREGQVVNATRNGHPLKDPRTWDTWSVPGMFYTIEVDLDALDDSHGDHPGVELWLGAVFDEQHGLPRRYRRVQPSRQMDTSWEITQWKVDP